MPTLTEFARSDPAILRSSLGLTIREVAALTHVSSATALRWERGGAMPASAQAILEELAEDESNSPSETVLRAVGEGGRTVPELRSVLSTPRQRRELTRLIDDGTLCRVPVARRDARGRAYRRDGVFRASDGRPRGLDRSAPLASGPSVGQARRILGLTVEELAEKVGIAPSTLRGWEATTPPRARLPQLAEALDKIPSGDQIRRLKEAAGWSLEELARPIGVHPSVVHNWMTGHRPVPAGRKVTLLSALADAHRAAGAKLRIGIELTELAVAKKPGVLLSQFRHRQRIRRKGAHRPNLFAERALKGALREGRIVIADDFRLDVTGRPRPAKRLYLRDQAPRPVDGMTGDQLGALRSVVGWSQRELANALGISSASVSVWERRHDRTIPGNWAMGIREAVSQQQTLPHPEKLVTDEILSAVRRAPGIAHCNLRDRVGHSKAATRSLAALVAEGTVVERDAWDSLGRKYVGFYPSEIPAPSIQRLGGPALRRERVRAGLTAAELGGAIGVGGNAVTRWETGARSCPPARSASICAALSEALALRVDRQVDRQAGYFGLPAVNSR